MKLRKTQVSYHPLKKTNAGTSYYFIRIVNRIAKSLHRCLTAKWIEKVPRQMKFSESIFGRNLENVNLFTFRVIHFLKITETKKQAKIKKIKKYKFFPKPSIFFLSGCIFSKNFVM